MTVRHDCKKGYAILQASKLDYPDRATSVKHGKAVSRNLCTLCTSCLPVVHVLENVNGHLVSPSSRRAVDVHRVRVFFYVVVAATASRLG